jgi:hypothetical protein
MDFEVVADASEFSGVNDHLSVDSAADPEEDDSITSKEKRYRARRKIEDWVEYKKMRDELGWMDDFDLDMGEVY